MKELQEHMGMVINLSAQIKNSYTEQEDLIQEGLIALSYALDKYDDKCNTSLPTFLYRCIKNKMINYSKNQRWLNGFNESTMDKRIDIELTTPTIDEHLDLRIERKVDILAQTYKLTDRQLHVFFEYFIGKGISRIELAKQMGITHQRVSMIISKIVSKMEMEE